MCFHPEKCGHPIASQDNVNTTRRPTPFMNTHVQVVDSGKYLGFNINKDLTWTKHINQNSEKASKTLMETHQPFPFLFFQRGKIFL
jgi:hypothetical protein